MKIANQQRAMRDVLIEAMHSNKKIFFLSADFGSPALEPLRAKFKDRFINVGIAEQNMINIATGLALEGFIVYAYAIAPFITMRPYEQSRVNLSLFSQIKSLNVNLIGVGAGVSYDLSGPTHHCLEDLSIMRTLPNFTVFSPSDWVLAEKFLDFSLKHKNPKYARFDSKPLSQIYERNSKINFDWGFQELIKAENVCIVSTGYMTHIALLVAERLKKEGKGIGVVDVFLLKPINEKLLFRSLKKYKAIITLEEGFIGKGGLDIVIANILANYSSRIIRKSLGFSDSYVFGVGNRNYLYRESGIDQESIAKLAKKLFKER
jgi:transketolase